LSRLISGPLIVFKFSFNYFLVVKNAEKGGYAVGAFNVYNLEGIEAVVAAAETEKSPAILQVRNFNMLIFLKSHNAENIIKLVRFSCLLFSFLQYSCGGLGGS